MQVNPNDENFYPEAATFHYWNWYQGELVLRSSPLYGTIQIYDTLDVKWQYRIEKLGGCPNYGPWIDMNQSAHKVYIVYSDPDPPGGDLFDFALENACTYAANELEPAPIAAEIRQELYADFGDRYAPDGYWFKGADVLEIWSTTDTLICSTYANVMAYLALSVGLDAHTEWYWAGSAAEGYVWLYTVTQSWGTILVDPGSHLWGWHAVASTPEGYSDAALGVTGVDLVHKDPRGTEQYADSGDQMSPPGPPMDYVTVLPEHHWP